LARKSKKPLIMSFSIIAGEWGVEIAARSKVVLGRGKLKY